MIARIAILIVVLGYLLLPLFAMLEFSTRGDFGSRSLNAFTAIIGKQDLIDSVTTTLQIAVLTVVGMLVLLVPTMVWTIVRVPRMRRVIEFLCLLPLAIPAIVLVVQDRRIGVQASTAVVAPRRELEHREERQHQVADDDHEDRDPRGELPTRGAMSAAAPLRTRDHGAAFRRSCGQGAH